MNSPPFGRMPCHRASEPYDRRERLVQLRTRVRALDQSGSRTQWGEIQTLLPFFPGERDLQIVSDSASHSKLAKGQHTPAPGRSPEATLNCPTAAHQAPATTVKTTRHGDSPLGDRK